MGLVADMKVLGLLAGLVAVTAALHDNVHTNLKSFEGYKVYKTHPTENDLQFMRNLQFSGHYDFWTEVRKDHAVDIMVPPSAQSTFIRTLNEEGIKHEVMIEDAQSLINLERAQSGKGKKVSADHDMTWTDYHSLEDMYSFLDYLETTYDFVTTQSVGKSYEGRDMRLAKICKGECGSKPAVWIDGGIHAREWVSPATTTWMLKELVENDAAHPDLLENLDWFILPSANPDGYDWSRNHNRMWRKTRSSNGGILGCKGVDANRNWGFHWNEGGSSNDRCSDTYHGPSAFSEVENVNVRDFLLARKDKIVFYNSIHSYSQLILLPWGFQNETPNDYDNMYALAMKGSAALTAVHGKNYETGCIPCMLYIASGSSTDWAHGNGINFHHQ